MLAAAQQLSHLDMSCNQVLHIANSRRHYPTMFAQQDAAFSCLGVVRLMDTFCDSDGLSHCKLLGQGLLRWEGMAHSSHAKLAVAGKC